MTRFDIEIKKIRNIDFFLFGPVPKNFWSSPDSPAGWNTRNFSGFWTVSQDSRWNAADY